MRWETLLVKNTNREILILSCIFPAGKTAYYALLPHGSKWRTLPVAALKAPLDLHAYGEIVASGWGVMSDAVRRDLMQRYGS